MKYIIYKTLPLLLMAFLVTSCVSTDITRMSNKDYPKVHSENVQVFMEGDEIKQDYDRIAIIYSEGSTSWTDKSDLINKSKEEAAEMGANAIVMGGIDEPSTGAKIAGAVTGFGSNRQGEVIAIRLLEDEN